MSYNEDSIKVFKGLDGVRHKPAMYLGRLGDPVIKQVLKEVIDNSIDEALAGHNTFLGVKVEGKKNQSFIVVDKGRGIPVGIHKKTKMSTLTTILTTLHAGGKMDDKSYKVSTGTHGVGVSCANAVSKMFEVWTCRKKQWYYQSFSKGKPKAKVKKVKFPSSVVKGIGADKTKGTIIKYTPDFSVLGKSAKLTDEIIEDWFTDISMLNTKLRLRLITDAVDEKYYNTGGPQEYLTSIIEDEAVETIGKPFIFEDETISIAIQWTDYDGGDGVYSFVNGGYTEENGTHVVGLNDCISKAFKDKALNKHTYTATDLRYGVLGFINYKLSGAEFDGQTKEKLVTAKAKKIVSDGLLKPFIAFLNKNKKATKEILDRATNFKFAKEQARELTKAATKITKRSSKTLLPGKLTASSSKCKPADRVLYLVEGDSAGGGAKKARNRKTDDILCLKGNCKVQLTDGSSISIKKMAENSEKKYYGFTFNRKTSIIEPCLLHNPRVTRYNARLVKVYIDNNTTFCCTSDHKILLKSGKYKEAGKLQETDSLMPIKVSEYDNGYLYCSSGKGFKQDGVGHRTGGYVHKLVYTKFHGKIKTGNHIHHPDEDKLNNVPNNVEQLTPEDHTYEHLGNWAKENGGYISDCRSEYLADPAVREHLSKKSKAWWDSKSDEDKKATIKRLTNPKNRKLNAKKLWYRYWRNYISQCRELREDWQTEYIYERGINFHVNKWYEFFETELDFESYLDSGLVKPPSKVKREKNVYGPSTGSHADKAKERLLTIASSLLQTNFEFTVGNLQSLAKEMGVRSDCRYMVRTHYNGDIEYLKECAENFNHKVVKVTRLKGTHTTYCLDVRKHHNFALENGIFVHNCLKGKPINTAKCSLPKALANKEVQDILVAIGKDPKAIGKKSKLSEFRVGKIVIAADRDVDGHQIEMLLTTLFDTLTPEVFTYNMIYVARPPLFVATGKGQKWYGNTLKDVKKKAKKGSKTKAEYSSILITRFKGLGECLWQDLKEFIFEPTTRNHIQITSVKGKDKKYFDNLVGNDTATRKKLLGIN